MFQSVIERQRAGRLGSGVWVSIGVHAALFAAVLFISARVPEESRPPEPPPLDFPELSPGVTPKGTPAPATPKQGTQRPPRARRDRVPSQVRPLPTEPAHPVEPDPTDEVATPDVPGDASTSTKSIGLPIGVDLGGPGWGPGLGSGVPTGEDHEPFGQGMTPPVLLGGQHIDYTPQALAARVEGTLVAKCVITVEGRVRDCKVLKGLPHMDEAVLDALHSRRYRPVTFQGRPVSVSYSFTLRLSLPR
ncbi:energy transducer TonB [Pyxidicoccus xibeiensis]|uniref:energy transducer TonB n=1 Tax=Pyxidicoccus xibeiensis TaxID=2906759 RepID=UPI0020A6DF9E|nr:energy transducer TonB [Pyxidicoccus xibeiensis]MCP3141057.1 TonB family protein [Pyxidicoccus xibeiensis]